MTGENKAKRWSYIRHDNHSFHHIGILADGSLWNPQGYPVDQVRAAIAWVLEEKRQRRLKGIKRGVETRKRRRASRIAEAARKLLIQHGIGDRLRCYCCNKRLTDSISIARGIGPECWEHVLRLREQEGAA